MVGLCAMPLNPLSAGYNTIRLASVSVVYVCVCGTGSKVFHAIECITLRLLLLTESLGVAD